MALWGAVIPRNNQLDQYLKRFTVLYCNGCAGIVICKIISIVVKFVGVLPFFFIVRAGLVRVFYDLNRPSVLPLGLSSMMMSSCLQSDNRADIVCI